MQTGSATLAVSKVPDELQTRLSSSPLSCKSQRSVCASGSSDFAKVLAAIQSIHFGFVAHLHVLSSDAFLLVLLASGAVRLPPRNSIPTIDLDGPFCVGSRAPMSPQA